MTVLHPLILYVRPSTLPYAALTVRTSGHLASALPAPSHPNKAARELG